MASEMERLSALMSNARLLIDYNSSTDILPSSKLSSALKDAEAAKKQGDLEFSSQQAETLRAEVQRMVSAIKPSTIVELREFPPFTSTSKNRNTDIGSGWKKLVRPVLYGVSCSVVIFLCAYLTIWARDAEQFIRGAQSVQQRLASEALQSIVGRWTTVPINVSSDTEPWNPSDFGESPRDFRAMADLLVTYQVIDNKTTELSERLSFKRRPIVPPPNPEPDPVDPGEAVNQAASPVVVEAPNRPQSYSADPSQAEECLKNYKAARTRINNAVEPYFEPQSAESTPITRLEVSRSALFSWASERMYSIHQSLLACTLRLSAETAAKLDKALDADYYIERVRDVRNKVDFLSTWIIPGLYGMLGAIFMNLQIYQDPIRPPQNDGRIIIRVIMGGFIGLVIGWFWSPSSSELFDFANINVGLFTVAFLFGYGADVFMNLLQRTTQSLATAVEGGAGH